MRRPYNSVIRALMDSLSKPDLDPCAREILERRLEYHQGRLQQKRREASRPQIHKAILISAQRRKERTRKKIQELLPLILRLRGGGKTYKEIEDDLRAAGVINTKGNPYSSDTIRRMVIGDSPSGR